MKHFVNFYKELTPEFRKINFYIFGTYFFLLFSYPLSRSSTSAIFYESYTAKDYSLATFIGVIVLMISISISNKWQSRLGIHKLYCALASLFMGVLLISFVLYYSGYKEMAYVIFATKETYIVLLLHSCLAFANSFFNLEQLKRFIGPIGAVGALGGILGGQLTAYLAKGYGTDYVFLGSLVLIFTSMILFYLTKDAQIHGSETHKKSITPIKAIKGVKKYVFLIAGIVAVSQFVIYIADLQFNLIFEKVVTSKDERTAYLGTFYSYINLVSIILQFIVVPYVLIRFKLKHIFLSVPILYLLALTMGLSIGAQSLMVTACVFITFKGVDYSLLNSVKEVMYNPLLTLQKFGAKYITDMFVYRFAKASIAFVFVMEFFKSNFLTLEVLSILQFVFLVLWVFLIILLFKEQVKIKEEHS